jgi:D-proline reductase (dithiol) PrdB
VGLIQRILEERGISTVSISLNLAISKKVKPPRALYPGFSLGHPLGRPHDRDIQLQVLQDALELLEMDLEPGKIVIRSY